MVPKLQEHKLYQIKENSQIEFASEHKVVFPFAELEKAAMNITEDNLIYILTKEKNRSISAELKQFLERNEMEWDGSAKLAFECSYGPGMPKDLKLDFLGKIKGHSSGEGGKFEIGQFVETQVPIINQKLLVVKCALDKSTFRLSQDNWTYFLAEFDIRNQNLIRRVFLFNLSHSLKPYYQDKLRRDKDGLPEYFGLKMITGYRPKGFFLSNNNTREPGCVQKFTTFLYIETEMVTIGVLDLRRRRMVAKRLVSIYELFEGHELAECIEGPLCTILDVEYCLEADILVWDLVLEATNVKS